jgi:LytS/YehU family sensor histidine kinase
MYRFILEHGEQKLIPLDRELDLIENFIYLQKTRFGDQLKLTLEIKDKTFSLPPFSLQLLLENAIKHNIISATQPMEILITQEGEKLIVSNPVVPRLSSEVSTGIGLKNLSSRYQLLIQKDIEIIQSEGTFKVILPLIPDA